MRNRVSLSKLKVVNHTTNDIQKPSFGHSVIFSREDQNQTTLKNFRIYHQFKILCGKKEKIRQVNHLIRRNKKL